MSFVDTMHQNLDKAAQRALILHRSHQTVEAIIRQLTQIGMSAEQHWPELPHDLRPAGYAVVFFDADMGHDEQFPWLAGEAPIPTIALIGSEAPGRIAWAIKHGADAHLLKPVAGGGIYSAVLLAREAFARRQVLRQELGIGPDTCVMAYHGNVHGANFHEVRSLYLATALLNRRGVPAKLLRLGASWDTQPPEYHHWTAEFCLELGFVVDRQRIADVLAAADVFVQPGTSDPFNDYRFPSKLPEFFAIGRPVVLPRTNLGTMVRHGEDAYVLERADAAGIAAAVTELRGNPALREKLSRGALAFAAEHFSWRRSAESLEKFYLGLLPAP